MNIKKLFLVLLLVSCQTYAIEYDEVGTLDRIGGGVVLVSDTAYTLSKTVDCYSLNNSKDISCFKFKQPQWVGIVFRAPRSRDSHVVKIYAVNEGVYEEYRNDD